MLGHTSCVWVTAAVCVNLDSWLTDVRAHSCSCNHWRGAVDADPWSDEVPGTGSLREGVRWTPGGDASSQGWLKLCWLVGNTVNLHHTQNHISDPILIWPPLLQHAKAKSERHMTRELMHGYRLYKTWHVLKQLWEKYRHGWTRAAPLCPNIFMYSVTNLLVSLVCV